MTDVGQEFAADFRLELQQALGMRLMQTLTIQLEGEFEIYSNDKWMTFQIEVPING